MDGRRRTPDAARLTPSSNISEPELDMHRHAPVLLGPLARIYGMIRRLIADGHNPGSPMRSVARELEESWPAGEY